jgi:hypothetical protein
LKIKILKSFSYGSVSDPQRMVAGNTQDVPDGVSEQTLDTWLKMGWVEWVPEWEEK